MKKPFSFLVPAILLACIIMSPSCKKVYHDTNPTPSNTRLLGYTRIITKSIIAPITLVPVVTETYSFAYDGNNKLSQILFSTNDSNMRHLGLLDLRTTFTYSGGDIIRTVYNIKNANVVERDSFYQNGNGQILNASFPTQNHSFTYAGNLIASQTDTYSDSGTTISATSYFTSDHNDLLNQLFNGTLTATFPDSGIRPAMNITALYPMRDSILSYPLTITWTTYAASGPATATHHPSGQSDVLTGYSQYPVTVDGVDGNGIYIRTATFPGGLYASRFFQTYDYLNNRIGDYLQLQSFTTYGANVYQSGRMVKQMSTPFDTTFVTYNIDGQSRVTQTSAVIKDRLGNNTSIIYKLQYDTN